MLHRWRYKQSMKMYSNFNDNLPLKTINTIFDEEKEVCRLCLQKNPSVKIFNNQVIDKIHSCCNIEIHIEDSLPKCICIECSNILEYIITFKNKCEYNDKILRDRLIAKSNNLNVKEEDVYDDFVDNSFTYDEMLIKDSGSDLESKIKTIRKNTPKKNNIKLELPIEFDGWKSKKSKANGIHKSKSIKKPKLEKVVRRKYNKIKNLDKLKQCPYCSMLFSKTTFHPHLFTHSERPYECDICHKMFKYKKNVHQHIESHNTTKTNIYKLRKKPAKAPPVFIGICKLCGKTINNLNQYCHIMDKSKVIVYECYECKIPIASKTCYLVHMKRHAKPVNVKEKTASQQSQCYICGKVHSSKKLTNKHIIIAHLKNDFFECNLCGRVMRKNSKPYHMAHAHVHEKKFECDYCHQKFISRERIRQHLQTHSSIKPFQCDICLLKFTRNNTLKRHKERHENRLEKNIKRHLTNNYNGIFVPDSLHNIF